MITNEILNALKSYAAKMQKTVTFVLQAGEHTKRAELVKFLSDIASASDKIQFEEVLRGERALQKSNRR